MTDDNIETLYLGRSVLQWTGDKTMDHASGIWGRPKMLEYLQKYVINKGDAAVDFGCGAGFPTLQLAEMVGEDGRVIGLDSSEAMIIQALHYQREPHLTFHLADITKPLSIEPGIADVATAFMVCHNLRLPDLRAMLQNVEFVLKPGGTAVLLTMHGDALDSDWQLSFMKYDQDAIELYRRREDKEGVLVRGVVQNTSGGKKEVAMYTHTRFNFFDAIKDAGLTAVDGREIWSDQEIAEQKFGANSVILLPSNPIFWIVVLRK